jgi:hypothetical protein
MGYGLSFLQYKSKMGNPDMKRSYKPGNSLMVGMGYKYQFKKLVALGIDFSGSVVKGSVFYETQGLASWFTPNLPFTRVQTNAFKFIYVSAPVYINFFYKRFSIDLGFQISLVIPNEFIYSDKWTYSNGMTSNITSMGGGNYLSSYDYGPFIAPNFTVWKGLNVFIRYYQGMSNIYGDLTNKQILAGVRYNFSGPGPKITEVNVLSESYILN